MTLDEQQAREKAQHLYDTYISRGDVLNYFSTLYQQAQGDASAIPWADQHVNTHFKDWAERQQLQGNNRRALVVGCGLGDDAEALASLGFQVTAFDIAPEAIEWSKRRFPETQVHYEAANLFALPQAWQQTFDFILEIYTIQTLPYELRSRAMECISLCLAPGGDLLVICRGTESEERDGKIPSPLSRQSLSVFQSCGLQEVTFDDFYDQEEPPKRRFRIHYHLSNTPSNS
jgi:SAM-dependent methyltransferase